jgi:hypothetical protein
MKKLLSDKQIKLVKEYLKDELTKKGFHTNFNIKEVEGRNNNILELTLDKFNTTPVIFKSLELINFGSGVIKSTHAKEFDSDKTDVELIKVWISVNAKAEYFNGGSNSFPIFSVSGLFYDDYKFHIK